MKSMFESLDPNGDGFVTIEEFLKALSRAGVAITGEIDRSLAQVAPPPSALLACCCEPRSHRRRPRPSAQSTERQPQPVSLTNPWGRGAGVAGGGGASARFL